MNTTPTIIIGAGSVSKDQFFSVYDRSQRIIAADGGANYLKEWDVKPEMIVGDMDSVEDLAYWEGLSDVEIKRLEDQNSTDLEKILDCVETERYFAFGFSGDRFDHTLEILHVLDKYEDKDIVFFVGGDVIWRLPEQTKLKLPVGSRLSLYPLCEVTASGSGLKYPFENLTFKQGTQIGTSNEVIEECVTIEQNKRGLLGITYWKNYKNLF